jgi:uncharacterized protein YkwD
MSPLTTRAAAATAVTIAVAALGTGTGLASSGDDERRVTKPATKGSFERAVALLDAEELRLIRLTNDYRRALGLGQLLVSPRLQREAEWYAADMAAHDSFTITHVDSEGRDLWERLADFHYHDKLSAQNSATGSPDAAVMLKAFIDSPPHHDTLKYGKYRVTAAAVARNPYFKQEWYWVATFGQTNDRPRPGSPDELIAVPPRPALSVGGCRIVRRARARCRAGRSVRLRARAGPERVAIDLQHRDGARWSATARYDERRMTVRLAAGERMRARPVAFPRSVEGADAGRWRVLRGVR